MKLIIDTDPGVDDALAIALAHAMPQIELLGLTTIFGNTFVERSSRNARYLLDMLGADVPVAQGAALPYGATSYTPSANVHGPEGFGDMAEVPQIGRNLEESAPEFLVRMAATYPGEVTVCAIGPMTNIADAVRLDPDFADNLGRLVMMGGAYECPGNITPYAEANIYHDAIAADEVFAAGFDGIMVGLNATMQTLLTPIEFAQMGGTSPQVGGFINRISEFYLEFYRSVGVMDGCPMHDGLAILACTDPDRFTLLPAGIGVIRDGEEIGQTVPDASNPVFHVAMGVDVAWAHATVMEQIATLS